VELAPKIASSLMYSLSSLMYSLPSFLLPSIMPPLLPFSSLLAGREQVVFDKNLAKDSQWRVLQARAG